MELVVIWIYCFMLLSWPQQAASFCTAIGVQTDRWIHDSLYPFEYYVTSTQYNLPTCVSFCSGVAKSSSLAMFYPIMTTTAFEQKICLENKAYWIKDNSGYPCITIKWPTIQHAACTNTYQCICQRRFNRPSTTTPQTEPTPTSPLVEHTASETTHQTKPYTPVKLSTDMSAKLSTNVFSSSTSLSSTSTISPLSSTSVQAMSTMLSAQPITLPATSAKSSFPSTTESKTSSVKSTTRSTSLASFSSSNSIQPSPSTEQPLKEMVQTIDNNIYAVVYTEMKYAEAITYCLTKYNSSFMSISNPLLYITTTESLTLTQGSYWVHKKDERMDACLVVTNRDDVTIARSQCGVKNYVICNDVKDDGLPLRDEGFVEMISNMTVDQKQTKKWLNSMQCAEDKRKSAQVMGKIGASIMATVGAFVVCLDLQRLVSYLYRVARPRIHIY